MRVATFDIETNGLFPEVDTVHCAAVKSHDDGAKRSFTPDTIHTLCDYLDTFDVLISHNGIAFDFPVLRKVFGYEHKGIKVDTLLMSRLQRPKRIAPKGSNSGPHSVESWGIRLGAAKVENEEWGVFTPHMLHRCEQDVEIQYKLYHALLEEGRGEGWASAHKLNHKLHHYLQLQEEYGWQVDEALLDRGIYMLNRWIDKIANIVTPRLPYKVEVQEVKKDGEYGWIKRPFVKTGALSKAVGTWVDSVSGDGSAVAGPFSRVLFRPLDINSNAEIKTFLLAQGWEPSEWNTNSEGQRTSPKLSKDDEFEGIQGSLGKLIAKRIQCRQRLGVLEGWKEGITQAGRIHAGIAGIASTARLKHRVIVNVPSVERESFFAKWMRKMFVASPGMVMVGVDSAGNQMRQLAARMREAGAPDEEFEYALIHGNKEDGTDEHSVNMRKANLPTRGHAKNFFYGLIFGASDWKTGKLVQGGPKEGKAIKEEYFGQMPGIKQTIDSLTEEWRASAQKYYDPKFGRMVYRNGYITGRDGRPILVESEHAVLCYALQSDEAIQMSVAYVVLHKRAEARGWLLHKDWAMLYWCHDEFQMECKPEIAEELRDMACEAIAWAGRFLQIPFPHQGDGEIGRSWYDCH